MRKTGVLVLFVILVFVTTNVAFSAAFKSGEKLTFSISLNEIMKAGTATMSVKGVKMFNGAKVYHVVTTAQSGSYLDSFFYVRDRVESYFDVKTYASWKYEKHLVEGDYTSDEIRYFDPNERTCTYSTKTIRTKENAVDVLAAFYKLRTMDLSGGTVYVNYSDGRDNKEVAINILGKEKVTVPAGTFNTIKVTPILNETKGIFLQEGEMIVWVTDDERKMPVKMASKITIGEVVASLESYK